MSVVPLDEIEQFCYDAIDGIRKPLHQNASGNSVKNALETNVIATD